jgi:small-conductance mechanosensitive channel
MLDESRYAPLINVIDKLDVFLDRRPVQLQLLTLAVLVAAAFIVAKAFWIWALPRSLQWTERVRRDALRRCFVLSINLAHAASFPVLSLVLLGPTQAFLESQDLPGGLLEKTNWVLATLLLFRIGRTLLYAALQEETAKWFHYRLLNPLLFVLILIGTLDNLTDVGRVYDIELAAIFGTVLKLGPVCIATVGLYFLASGLSLVDELIHRFVAKQTRLDPGRSKATLTLARYVLLIAGVITAFAQFELEPSIVAAISGGLSIGVGFGLREILSNFISGFLLLFERSLIPGDVIDMDDQISVVEKLSVRATTVRTLNNEELVIPNQTFLTASFKTYTGSDKKVRVPIMLQTDCDINPEYVIELLIETASEHESVLTKPAPSVFLLEYANNVASFQLNIWLANPLASPRVQSEVKRLVWEAFGEHNVSLPFPEMDLHFPDRVPVDTTVENFSASRSADD